MACSNQMSIQARIQYIELCILFFIQPVLNPSDIDILSDLFAAITDAQGFVIPAIQCCLCQFQVE